MDQLALSNANELHTVACLLIDSLVFWIVHFKLLQIQIHFGIQKAGVLGFWGVEF